MNEDRMNEYLDNIDSEMGWDEIEELEELIDDKVNRTMKYVRGAFPNFDFMSDTQGWLRETFEDDPDMSVDECGQFFIDHFDLYSPDWREITIPTKWELSNN